MSETGKFHQERFVIDTNKLQSTVVFMPLKKRVVEKSKVEILEQNRNKVHKVISHAEYKKKLAAKKKNKTKNIKKTDSKKKLSQANTALKSVVKESNKVEITKKPSTTLQQEKNKKAAENKAVKIAQEKALAHKKEAEKKALEKKHQDLLAVNAQIEKDKKIAEDKKAKIIQEKADQAKDLARKLEDQKNADKKLADQILEDQKKKNQEKIEKIVENQEIAAKASVQSANKDLALSTSEPVVIEDVISNEELSEDDDLDLDTISFVGSRDLEMMQIKEQIQIQIIKYYKPPVGISKKAVCDLSVFVGPHGKATRIIVKKGSGSVANDICARTALLKVAFPKEVIGKKITIALGQ